MVLFHLNTVVLLAVGFIKESSASMARHRYEARYLANVTVANATVSSNTVAIDTTTASKATLASDIIAIATNTIANNTTDNNTTANNAVASNSTINVTNVDNTTVNDTTVNDATANDATANHTTVQDTVKNPVTKSLPPSKDPWYSAPKSYAFAQRGDVMKIRIAPGNLTAKLKNLKRSDQIIYRTADTNDFATWSVTTVLSPKTLDPNWPSAVSYQIGYASANIDSSPSYMLSTASGNIRYDILDRMLEKGWVIIIPDYQGPNSVFGAGKFAGHAVLDSIRAVRSISVARYGLEYTTMSIISWGYSGGALATAWSHLLISGYAVDLIPYLTSFVMGGLPVNILSMIQALNGTKDAGVAISAISGLMQEYPHINGTIQLAAKTTGPFNITAFDAVRTQTYAESTAAYANHSLEDYFSDGFNKVLGQLRRGGFDRDTSLLKRPMPKFDASHRQRTVFFYHAVDDKVAPIEDVMYLLHKKWCSHLHTIEIQRNHEGGHVEAEHASMDTILEWMARRFLQLWKEWDFINIDGTGLTEYSQIDQCTIHEISAVSTWDPKGGLEAA